MDFFEHQHVAKRKTGRLVVLMVLAVLAIIALVYVVVVLAAVAQTDVAASPADAWLGLLPRDLPYLKLLGGTAVGVLVVVIGGSLYKTAQLSGGGKAVAVELGGRPVDPDTADADERRLLNVVQEMAIASGTPVPEVYVLDHEEGINAFAAGWSLDDAVIGVTRGAVRHFTRDELQGVIAHEFSHILHGDMRLNLRLVGIIFGILALSVVGATAMRAIAYSGARGTARRRNSKGNGAGIVIAVFLVGLALFIIGYVGVFFGRLIQAAVSRQREFLADAAAVQYTRNPDGIADALRRLGGLASGSRLETAHAVEHRHLFFGEASRSALNFALATHPPLPERIRRVQPSWDGSYLAPREGEAGNASSCGRPSAPAAEAGRSFAGLAGQAVAATALEQIGNPAPEHVAYAHRLIEALPAVLRSATRTPTGAQAVVLGLLLDRRSADVRATQQTYLRDTVGGPLAALTHGLADAIHALDDASRLPLLDLALPALIRLPEEQLAELRRHVDALIAADGRVQLFEWALSQVLWHRVGLLDAAPPSRRLSLAKARGAVEALLVVLAQLGGHGASADRSAFEAAAAELPDLKLTWPGETTVPMARLTAAVDELARLRPADQRRLIAACGAAVAADGHATTGEVELMRAVAETLGVPIPPLLPGQRLA